VPATPAYDTWTHEAPEGIQRPAVAARASHHAPTAPRRRARSSRARQTVRVIARRLRVHGVVQGVGFRWSMATEARRDGVTGWVRNASDGTVEAHVEGSQAAVDAIVAWSHVGPRFARITAG